MTNPDAAFMTAVVQRYSTALSQAQHQLIVAEVQQDTLRAERDEARADADALRAKVERLQADTEVGADDET